MTKGGGVMAQASRNAARAKPKAAKSKGSDSSSDELEGADVSSTEEERPPSKKSKTSAVSEQRAAKVINQFTFS
jgi:hypothetical protein